VKRIGGDALSEQAIQERLKAEAEASYRWSNEPGTRYAVHRHHYRKVLYVSAGSITFMRSGEDPVTLQRGDRLEIAPGAPHSAVVGTQGVVCWEGQARRAPG
jgi:quercetin dioxygenase-like cupin family protein